MTALPGLEPAATIRLERSVWGIDQATSEVAFGGLVPAGDARPRLTWHTVALRPVSDFEDHEAHLRWWEAMRAIGPAIKMLAESWGIPELVVLEQPFSSGHHTEPVSYYVLGIILGSIGRELGPATRVEFMPPQAWKKLATGHGYAPGLPKNASKTAKRKAEKARLLRWALEQGYRSGSSNEADAIGCAVAGARFLGRSV